MSAKMVLSRVFSTSVVSIEIQKMRALWTRRRWVLRNAWWIMNDIYANSVVLRRCSRDRSLLAWLPLSVWTLSSRSSNSLSLPPVLFYCEACDATATALSIWDLVHLAWSESLNPHEGKIFWLPSYVYSKGKLAYFDLLLWLATNVSKNWYL